MIRINYWIIDNDDNLTPASAEYETKADAEDIVNSMLKGVFDDQDIKFEFISLEEG